MIELGHLALLGQLSTDFHEILYRTFPLQWLGFNLYHIFFTDFFLQGLFSGHGAATVKFSSENIVQQKNWTIWHVMQQQTLIEPF